MSNNENWPGHDDYLAHIKKMEAEQRHRFDEEVQDNRAFNFSMEEKHLRPWLTQRLVVERWVIILAIFVAPVVVGIIRGVITVLISR